ncbi:cold shock domain-containing Unr isoform X2 [Oratosquilla oratoria]|uniref:cold shock domain-containing Unr isoform X2 n=1 Tax=Oratosquilla oratoria TaxID=337810 RepID=UPI003F769E48
MDPQWSLFQPPISDSAVLDYNGSLHQHYNRYNGLYDPPQAPPPHTAPPPPPPHVQQRSNSQGFPNPSAAHHSNIFSSHNSTSGPQASHNPTTHRSPSVNSSISNYYNGNSNSQYTPPVADFKIGTFTLNANGYPTESNGHDSNSSSFSQSNGPSSNNQSVRETGIIEKLLQTYGFIQCCERQARLFFHFSQFDGNTEHLRIGDPVEFEVTFDRRTGKPIASAVTKISPDVISYGQVLSEERVVGIVTTELRNENGGEQQGRITYENRGECFFLPYCKEDVEGYVTLQPGDKVSFQIATNQRTGNLAARHVRLENPAQPVKYQGVVSTIKDSYGFIERADVVDEIFFHFSETKNIPGGIKLGDDVEFNITTRNAKEVATNMVKLQPGTVVFEDINKEIIKGQVLKPVEKNNRQNQKDPLTGRIRYRGKDRSEVEVKFGERDQRGDFTLRHGDWVQFNIATDRRDHLQKATNISLLDDSFNVSGEKREQGVIVALKDGFGFIRCAERESRMFFHYSELLDPDREIHVSDEVEFTLAQDQTSQTPNRLSAIRIQQLPPGTVKFELLLQEGIQGQVMVEAQKIPKSPSKNSLSNNTSSNGNVSPTNTQEQEKSPDPGIISYQIDSLKENVNYYAKNCEKGLPVVGDKVEFSIFQVKRTKELVAMNLKIIGRDTNLKGSNSNSSLSSLGSGNNLINGNNNNINNNSSSSGGLGGRPPCAVHQGFVAALKETFGFIETLAHDKEIFFHFSNFTGDSNTELGQEVEYTLSSRTGPGGKVSAENVRFLPKGTLPTPKVQSDVLKGTVIRSLRSMNPDQQEYSGLVCQGAEEENLSCHEFGITSVVNKRELLQPGDQVTFQIDEGGRAMNIRAVRKKLIATVDTVKGQYGFLNYETEEGKKLFFHMTEVRDAAVNLSPGDEVEFVIITNHKTGKSSACNIARMKCGATPSQRPDRLISKLKNLNMDTSKPRIVVLRQPKGPDGTKGFKVTRNVVSAPTTQPEQQQIGNA